jgi:hypothetical protein
MKIQIEKELEDTIGWRLLFENKNGELFEGEVKEVRKEAVRIGVNNDKEWFKIEDLKVVDILN